MRVLVVDESDERTVLVRAADAAGATFTGLQKDPKCGTNCVSCVRELRRLAAARPCRLDAA